MYTTLIFAAYFLSFFGTGYAIPLLTRWRIMDNPTLRSNHTRVTPRGGGIAIITSILICFILWGIHWHIIAATILLAAVSFIDDMRGVSVHWRLLAQAIAVVIVFPLLPVPIIEAIPPVISIIILVFAWLWFINLTNFMDGIDGLTCMQVTMMALGILWVSPDLSVFASIILAATLGFFWFNRSPARVFMGDTGSITLGFLMGYLLITLACQRHYYAALILPAYYLSDATFTLLGRLLKGEKIWQAHSQHAYQQAVRSGLSHRQVAWRITGLNFLLVNIAYYAEQNKQYALAMLIMSYLFTALLLFYFLHRQGNKD